jgi:putative YphP/YqiW family bacilliredoxin
MALRHETRPARSITDFAGADIEATERARGYFTGYQPSSPSIALLKDGKLDNNLERSQIEGRDAPSIAQELTRAFDQFCTTTTAANA